MLPLQCFLDGDHFIFPFPPSTLNMVQLPNYLTYQVPWTSSQIHKTQIAAKRLKVLTVGEIEYKSEQF